MKPLRQRIAEQPWLGWVLFLVSALFVVLIGLITYSIIERRIEAQLIFMPVADIDPYEPRPEVWGLNFPRQFDTYLQMADNGAGRISLLEQNPRLAVLFAGFAFARDYNTARGHIFSVQDVRETLRTGAPMADDPGPQPATCWSCKTADAPRLKAQLGPAEFYAHSWAQLGHEAVNPISCANCHNPQTMDLRIFQPALVEAFERQGRDIQRATRHELRSLTCAQCHSEYYFRGAGNYLIFPWDLGTRVEDMERFKDEIANHTDWTHAISRAPMLKAQHPDYELFVLGIHYQRGVSCADCHMPFQAQGGVKTSDHQIQNPIFNIANSCQTCHRVPEADLLQSILDRRDAVAEVRTALEETLVRAHFEARHAWDLGASEARMTAALQLIRRAQWRWDYIAASHGASFHAPQEALRVLGLGMDYAQQARLELAAVLAELGHIGPVPLPDYSTHEAVMAFLGVDLQQHRRQKATFIEVVLPEWERRAAERHRAWDEARAAAPPRH